MLTLMLPVIGCAPTGPILTTEQACAGWREIEGTSADAEVISDTLVLSIDAHNRHGAGLGCWEYP